jgi:outer membrane protein
MLRMTIQTAGKAKRLELSGQLKGAWVLELERCWLELESTSEGLVVDLSEVDYLDSAGRYLLALMQERGARLDAGNPVVAQCLAQLARSGARRKDVGPILRALLVYAVILIPTLPAMAQDTVKLNLALTAQMAKERNLQVQAAKQGAATAKLEVDQVKSLRYGKVAVDASYLRLDSPVDIVSDPVHVPLFGGLTLAVPPVVVAPADLLHVRFEAGIPLFTGGRISNAVAAARAGQAATESLSEDTEASVILESSQLYLGALLARDVVRLHEQALESYGRHLENARTAFKMGVAANYDVVRAEAAVAEQERRLTESRNRSELVEAALRTSLSLQAEAPLELWGALFEPPSPQSLAEMQALAAKSNALLQALRKRVEALDRATRMEKGEYLPQIVAIAGKETVTAKLAQTDPNWFAGVQVTWTLFDGGARRARIKARQSEAEKARIEERHAAEQIELAVRSALLEYESQGSALVSARKSADLARESLSLATKRFAVGAGTSLEVLDANVALTAAETGALGALYQMDAAYLRMHRYIGDIAETAAKIQ